MEYPLDLRTILLAKHAQHVGLATGLIATACYIAVTALFYGLFKPVTEASLCSRRFSPWWDALLRLSVASFNLPPWSLWEVRSTWLYSM
jgi:hypothetical protein